MDTVRIAPGQGHLVAVTRDDLVGQNIGHTAPKTKDVLKLAVENAFHSRDLLPLPPGK